MKILIAPDSFKHSLSADKVADAIEKGIRKALPEAQIVKMPIADGGEGFVKAMLQARHGQIVNIKAHDPLMRKIDSFYGRAGDVGIIEMAAASGIELLKEEELNPLKTTTYGTGELIKEALKHGCKKIIIGIGGSATNDGGVGMAQALGIRFLDKVGMEISSGGGELVKIHNIDTSSIFTGVYDCEIIAACDVENPLTGKDGASHVYGPQKGADYQMVRDLDEGLKNLAGVIERDLGIKVLDMKGSGAAGGLGAGILAFLKGRLQSGFQVVSEMTDLENHVKQADIIVSGEGRIDAQTGSGKTIGSLAKLAERYNKSLIVISGSKDKGAQVLLNQGVTAIFSIMNKPMSLNEALSNAADLLELESENIFRLVNIQK